MLTYKEECRNYLSGNRWIYQGNRIRPNDSWLFKWEEEGGGAYGRTIFTYYGTNNIEKLRNLVPKDFWVKN